MCALRDEATAEPVDWEGGGRVHNWRRYVNQNLRDIWASFTIEQRMIIAGNASDIAASEDWD